MNGEILDIETAKKLSKDEKELERLRINVNLKELENKELVKKVTKQDMEIHYLKKIKQIQELTENYLPHRMKQISDKNDSRCEYAVLELKKLYDAITMEKEKLLNKEVEDEEI